MKWRGAPLLGLAGGVLLGLAACAERDEGPTGPPTEVARKVFRALKTGDFDLFAPLVLSRSEAREFGIEGLDAEDIHRGALAMWEERFRSYLDLDAVDWESAEIVEVRSTPIPEEGGHATRVAAQVKSAAGIVWIEVVVGWFSRRWIVGMLYFRPPMLLGLRVELRDESGAWKALGLTDGDVIVAVDDKLFESWERMNKLWGDAMRRKEASLTIERGSGQHRQLRVDMTALAQALAAGGAALEPRAID